MQFKSTALLAFALVTVGVSAAPSPNYYKGPSGGYYKPGKNINVNQCNTNQSQNCCNVVVKGSSQHKRWTDHYEHLRSKQDDHYLDCKSSDGSATW